MNVLDLPMEKQREIAARMGMTHEEWVASTKKDMAEMDVFEKGIIEFEREAEAKGLPVNQHMQDKFDSNYR